MSNLAYNHNTQSSNIQEVTFSKNFKLNFFDHQTNVSVDLSQTMVKNTIELHDLLISLNNLTEKYHTVMIHSINPALISFAELIGLSELFTETMKGDQDEQRIAA